MAVHDSQNLNIVFDQGTGEFVITVRFHGDAIAGRADGLCPRCQSPSHLALWELEGPGSRGNTIWMTCGGEAPCQLNDAPLRWSRIVAFDGDWEDV